MKTAKKPPKTKHRFEQVFEFTTNRLSAYFRSFYALDAADVETISSRVMAQQFRLNAAQIRKDLAHFREFGVRGVGYYMRDLKRHLRQILGLDRRLRVAIVGAGSLGLALAGYPEFRQEGFEISALFDSLSVKIGQASRGGVPIHDVHQLPAIAGREKIRIAVIAEPVVLAQQVVNVVVASGVRAILSLLSGAFEVPPDVKTKSIDLTVLLESLSFFLAHGEGACG